MTRARLALLLALAAVAAAAPARAHIGTHEVGVRNNYYDPQTLRIDVGETVTWTVIDSGHTVTADDGRFDQDHLMAQGEQVQWTFTEDETVYYHCKIHSGSMFGVVLVGEGSPPPPPTGDPPEIRQVPSATFPTITAAAAGAPPRTIVEVAPGLYREDIKVTTPGMVLRGTGADPSAAIIDGGATRGVGVTVLADDVTVENLTIRRHAFAGIFAPGASDLTVEDVRLLDNTSYGVRAESAPGMLIRDTVASGHARAGYSVASCEECDTVVRGVTAQGNFTGFGAINAGGIVVRDSTFTGNGTGIALKSSPLIGQTAQETAPQRGAHIANNTITSNDGSPFDAPAPNETLELETGAAIWVNGGWFDRIEGNTIDDHVYGVVITGLLMPSASDEVVGNTITRSARADIAWDGIGLDVCFSGNGEAPTSEPPEAQTIYDCGLPTTAGVPFPVVDLAVLGLI